MKSVKQLFFIAVCAMLLFASCANIAYPTGGQVDKTPPQLLHATPPANSTEFKEKEITFTFDEYIVLKNVNEEFLCSPPLENKPDIKPSGKGFKLMFDEELKPNTTYTLLFGNAITDNNEGNINTNFSYTFSTGKHLDSLELKGSIKNAFTLKPEAGVFVLLYTKSEDSVVVKEQPYYVSKTDNNGVYSFGALKNGNYKLFALKDLNKNLKYDLATEDIAFYNENVSPAAAARPIADSLKNDSLATPQVPTNAHNLFLFSEIGEKQSLIFSEFLHNGHLLIAAKRPFNSLKFEILSPSNMSFSSELSNKKDSLHIWFDEKDIDSARIILSDESLLFRDTIKIKRHKEEEPTFHFVSSSIAEKHPYFATPTIEFQNPIHFVDESKKIRLIQGADTSTVSFSFTDELRRNIQLNVSLKADSLYILKIDSAMFTDIYKNVNDSLTYKFSIDKKEIYGNFILAFKAKEYKNQFIVQLLNDKEDVLAEELAKNDRTIKFPNLKPGNYKVKIIEDANGNKRWDSGNYWKKQQPEKVLFFEKPISIRANWDLKESYTFE